MFCKQFGMFLIPPTKHHPKKAFSPSWQHPKHYALRAVWDVFDPSKLRSIPKKPFPLASGIPNTLLFKQFGMFLILATKHHPKKAFSLSW